MEFDVVIVGSGPGGYIAAVDAARRGFKTAIVEKQYYGGVCLNVGCIPTKTLLKSAKVYSFIKHSQTFGVEIKNPDLNLTPLWAKMQSRKAAVVTKLTKAVKFLMRSHRVTTFEGEATAISASQVRVNNETLTFKNLIIATGSAPRHLSLPGFAAARQAGLVVDSTGILSLPHIPQRLVVIGGGVIGIEFAFLFAELGTAVTIVEVFDRILNLLDQSISQEMTTIAAQKGIKIFTKSRATAIAGQTLIFTDEHGHTHRVAFDVCLESVGRVPTTRGFDNIGLQKHQRSQAIMTDEYCRTNIPHIYAIGDVNGCKMLAHVASAEAHAAVAHFAADPHLSRFKIDYEKMPNAIYTHPEVATVGLTEQQAQAQQLDYVQQTFPLSRSGKALADGETSGFVKIIAGRKYREVIGAHIIAATATDMISEVTTLMASEGTITEIAKAVHPHPTISESLFEAAWELETSTQQKRRL